MAVMAQGEAVTVERLERARRTVAEIIHLREDGRKFLPILARLTEELAAREREETLLAEAHRIAAGDAP